MNGTRDARRRNQAQTVLVLTVGLLLGCEDPAPEVPPSAKAPPVMAAVDTPPMLTAAELRRQLGTDERAVFRRVGTDIVEAGLAGAGVSTIEPLKGLPLRKLDLGFCSRISDISVVVGMPLNTLILEGTTVADLSPIKGMQLQVLYLQDTPVTDLSVIQGMPIRQLNLKGVAVSDVTPFSSMPLEILWLPDTEVSDITPLSSLSLVSLDVQDTDVSSLAPLSHMTSLKRLNIAGTKVTDLRPVTGLRLERIILSPAQISQGLEGLRDIRSLGQIWTSHENQMTSAQFWERYDIGVWKPDPSSSDAKERESSETENTTPQTNGLPQTQDDNPASNDSTSE